MRKADDTGKKIAEIHSIVLRLDREMEILRERVGFEHLLAWRDRAMREMASMTDRSLPTSAGRFRADG
jgi:hypothetical protein